MKTTPPAPRKRKSKSQKIKEEHDDTLNDEEEEEEEEEDEAYERALAGMHNYQRFCSDGKITHLQDTIDIITPILTAPTKEWNIEQSEEACSNTLSEMCEKDGIVSLLLILCSQCHFHIGNDALSRHLDLQSDNNTCAKNHEVKNQDAALLKKATKNFLQSLQFWPRNATTLSVYANQKRMFRSSLGGAAELIRQYEAAAVCAQTLRMEGIALLLTTNSKIDEDGGVCKMWVEVLVLEAIGVEYESPEEEDEEEEEEEATEDDNNDENDEHLYFSYAAVEATSRFMCALLSSTIGRHEDAKRHMQRFGITHRVHPNVWEAANTYTCKSNQNRTAVLTSIPTPVQIHATNNNDNDNENGSTDDDYEQQQLLFVPKCRDSILPPELYKRMCRIFAPDSVYWNESSYDTRGYHSYWLDLTTQGENKAPQNIIEECIMSHLLPRAKEMMAASSTATATSTPNAEAEETQNNIVGAEWWVHHRPVGANLGHQLHFDTDEALLDQQKQVTHPLISSVLYLTGGDGGDSDDKTKKNNAAAEAAAGSTIVFHQDPHSNGYAKSAYISRPVDNSFMTFPGNLLHGVLPCFSQDGSAADNNYRDEIKGRHRLTFMVGFWTRRVPDHIKKRPLYSACGVLPPKTRRHTWVSEIVSSLGEMRMEASLEQSDESSSASGNKINGEAKFDDRELIRVSPAWESLKVMNGEVKNDVDAVGPMCDLPFSINHRFFVREKHADKMKYFWDTLFEK